MIIFGFSTKEKAKRSGKFECPACHQHSYYDKLVRARRFTIFFIPILPLGSSDTGRVVCENCGSEFAEQVAGTA